MGGSMKTTVFVAVLVAGVAASTTLLLYIVRKKRRENKIPTEWKKVGYVKQLYLFPLKSAHCMEIDAAECTEVGFRLIKGSNNPVELRDRSFVVYGEENKEIKSGRVIPTLVKIEVSVHDDYHIALDAPQMRTLYVRIPDSTKSSQNDKVFLNVWSGEKIETIDCGDEAARWLSQIIAQKDSGYRLGYHDNAKRRDLVRHQDRMKYYKLMSDAATGLFSDVSSILIVNQASVNDYLKNAAGANVTALNFRPNIVIDGPDMKPYDEDNWEWMKIGDVIMRNVKECTRCVFTTVDPNTGIRNSNREPITTLTKFRMSKSPENEPIMGIHLEVKETGIIKSGNEVFVGCNK